MTMVSAIGSSASELTARTYRTRTAGTTRADLVRAHTRHAPAGAAAPAVTGLGRPMLDAATLLMAQDERWQAGPSTQPQLSGPANRGFEAYGLDRKAMQNNQTPVIDYHLGEDGQFYDTGEDFHDGEAAARAEAVFDTTADSTASSNQSEPASTQQVRAYRAAASMAAEAWGLDTPLPRVEITI